MSTQRSRLRCMALLALLLVGGVFGTGCAAQREEMYRRNRESGGWVWGRDGAIRFPGPQAIGGGGS